MNSSGSSRALLLLNRACQQGDVAGEQAARALSEAGLHVEAATPESTASLDRRIRERAGAVSRVVIAGGDGTIHAALPALIETGVPMAVLPFGTANDLARSLGLPLELDAACRVAAGTRTRRIDVARVNGEPFVNAAHIGLGAQVTRRLSHPIKQRWGVLGYARALWRAVDARRAFGARLELDGVEERVRCLHVGVGNARFFGGGMAVDEDAEVDDGRLAVFWLRPWPLWAFLLHALSLKAGRHRELDLTERRFVRRLAVVTAMPLAVTADGELVGETPARFESLPRALRVFVG